MKSFESNIFTKTMVIIFLLLIPILFLYGYSNKVSVRVLEEEMNSSHENQMRFFISQIDSHVEQIATNTVTLSRDPTVRDFPYLHLLSDWYDSNRINASIEEKLFLQSISDSWGPQYTLVAPAAERMISTDLYETLNNATPYDIQEGWHYRTRTVTRNLVSEEVREFVWYAVSPLDAYRTPRQAELIIESSFNVQHIEQMLDQFKSGGKGDPFFYHPEHGVIASRSVNERTVAALTTYLDEQLLAGVHADSMLLNDREYWVRALPSQRLGWYMVDYVPLETIMEPITRSRNLFYASTALLLTMSLLAAFLLYRHVRVPLRELMIHVQKLKRGDFSSRIAYRTKGEFIYVIQRFNEMADQIQQLIETVYEEKIRSRDSRLKQLQSQINPHFLYNCLFYIKNMAVIGEEGAVVKMSLSLADYFRYSTRLDIAEARIEEEIALLNNYLTIQQLRMKRIQYEIDIPPEMLEVIVPKLLLQPVVENAVVHGLESQEGEGRIRIHGEVKGQSYVIVVEDNGAGLDEKARSSLQEQISRPMDETTGYGLWNVHHRLMYRFGEGAGIRLSASELGGLRVELVWEMTESTGGERHVSIDAGG